MQDALEYLKDAIIEEPQNAEVWVWIAAIIDDVDKQAIFLEKALAIDPHNIPAQRGLAYIEKRKRDDTNIKGDHLSDHTHPISPFPTGKPKEQVENPYLWQKLPDGLLDELTDSAERDDGNALSKPANETQTPLKLTPFEISLLGVVTLVFGFIGLLAASSLFNFDLPFNIAQKQQPNQIIMPPSPGVFLYEDNNFFEILQHEGLPTQDLGIPTSRLPLPEFVIWQSSAEVDRWNLIHETGEIIPVNLVQTESELNTINPKSKLQPGLYCFEQPPKTNLKQEEVFYWCFHVNLTSSADR